jgi:hypothetical protein
MSKFLCCLICVAAFVLGDASPGFALPMAGMAIDPSLKTELPIQDARIFCYNRYSGRFLHWGSCAPVFHPRVYCRNRYSGRFLHWGSCY